MAVPIVEFAVWKKSLSVTIQMRVPTEQYFPVVLFITPYMQGGSRILMFDESYWAVLSLIVLFSY